MVEAQVHVDVDEVTEAKVAEDIDVEDIANGTTLRALVITPNTASHPNPTGKTRSFATNVVVEDTSREIVHQRRSMTHVMGKVTRPSATTVNDLGIPT